MPNNKSPVNDGLTKEFYESFWEEIKNPLLLSFDTGFDKKELSTSQRQAIIKLIEKKDKDKRFIQNRRPISLLNVDTKLLSKVLAERLKKVISCLISSNQTAYVDGRCISENGRLISDILHMTDYLNTDGLLVIIDIQKAFDSVNHHFLYSVLEKYKFGQNFIQWIKILTKNQESCVVNGGTTTRYFKLERGTRQGDPISAYLFILVLEIAFPLIKNSKKIEGLHILDHCFLYTAYADDTTFFLKNEESVREIMHILDEFSIFSGLKPNRSKCEIAGIGCLKGVHMALCGMDCIDLTKKSIKILGIHYSYDKHFENDENFKKHITKIEKVLKCWRTRYLTLAGKIMVFKSLAISKIIHLALVVNIPKNTINHLNNILKNFLWGSKTPKIKNSTLISDYQTGGLKNIDIATKISSLQCSWIKRLYDDTNHCWKIIPTFLIHTYLGRKFKFHSNLKIKEKTIKSFPKYYQEILQNWCNCLCSPPLFPSAIASQNIWYNSYIQISNESVYDKEFAKKGIDIFGQFFKGNVSIKTWIDFKQEFNLPNKKQFFFNQLVHAFPNIWKEALSNNLNSANNLVIKDHHLISKNQILVVSKLISKELYKLLITIKEEVPSAQIYFD